MQLNNKTRIYKEYLSYLKELEVQKNRIAKLTDEYDIRKQNEVLQETIQMIPDCKKRLENARMDLMNSLRAEESEEGSKVLEECVVAE